MVKSNAEKVEVYSKVDKKKLKLSIYLFIIATVWSIVNMILGQGFWIITVLGIILLTLDIYLYKKTSDEPKLEAVLTKEYVEFYKKRGNIKFEMKKIINFSHDTSSDFYHNEIFINYKDENDKKKTQIIYLKGIENARFCIIANNLLEGKNCEEEIEVTENKKEIEKGNFKIKEEKTLYCVGKEKIVNSDNFKAFPKYIDNIFYFIDEEGKEYNINLEDAYLKENLEKIEVKDFYNVKRKYDHLEMKKADKKFDTQKIEEYESRLDIKNILNTNQEIVEREVEIVTKFRMKLNILKYVFLIVIAMFLYIKYSQFIGSWILPININEVSADFLAIILFLIIIYTYSLMITTVNKIRKIQ